MKILIKHNAAAIYCRRFVEQQIPNREWAETLRKVEGKMLEVNTEYLFDKAFGTLPTEGVIDHALHIDEDLVSYIEGDVRPGKFKCLDCGACFSPEAGSCNCPKCCSDNAKKFVVRLVRDGSYRGSHSKPGG